MATGESVKTQQGLRLALDGGDVLTRWSGFRPSLVRALDPSQTCPTVIRLNKKDSGARRVIRKEDAGHSDRNAY